MIHKLHLLSMLFLVMLLAPLSVAAQTGGVTAKATISETVSLSVPPNWMHDALHADVMSSGDTVRITLSGGADADARVVRIPLRVRANSRFKISAAVEAKDTAATQLSIVDVRATGPLVSPQAVSEVNVPPQFDERISTQPVFSNKPDVSHASVIASGPRVSLGGTLNSPNNALEMTVLVRVTPQRAGEWIVRLTFAATAE